MNKKNLVLACSALLLFSYADFGVATTKTKKSSSDTIKYYATGLCKMPGYKCIKVGKGENWEKLFPDETQRDIVQRINRTNMGIWHGRTIAVPENLDNKTMFDFSPFPKQIQASNNKLIIVDQDKLAWGAYDRDGQLVKWGPISSGRDYCGDIKGACNTRSGEFYVFGKKNERCRSRIYPVGRGGSKMPYCMYFYKGFALHGSHEVPGYRASHGCVRLFTRDAKWLNQEFIELPNKSGTRKGTKVVVQALTNKKITKTR